jgi:hypothetical protein
MSKGSRQRPMNKQKFNSSFDKIFNKAKDIPELNVEWACYCEKINLIRAEYNLPSKVYTENDKKRFAKAHKAKYK